MGDLWLVGPDVVDIVGRLVGELVEEEVVARVHGHEALEVGGEAAPEHPGLVVPGEKCFPDTLNKVSIYCLLPEKMHVKLAIGSI